jgi:aminoglycoside phosphotransferase (APT) family kinase protein
MAAQFSSRPVQVTPASADAELGAWFAQRSRLFYAKTDLEVADAVLQGLRERTHQQLGMAADQIAAAYRHVFGTPPAAVEALDQQGTFHRLFRARGATGATCLVRASAAADLFRDFLLHLDPWVAARLHAAGLPAPRVYAVDTSRTVLALDYEILEEVHAPSLQQFNDDEPRMQALFRQLGEVAARVHAIPLDGFGFLDVRPLLAPGADARTALRGIHSTWRAYVELNLAEHVAACGRIGALTTAEADQVLSVFEANAARLAAVAPRLLHGDLGSHNVLTDGTAVVALIDWEDCLAGDPVFDVALWATFQPEHRYAAFLEGYRAAGPLPDDFEVRFWLYYLRVALAKTVHRHRFGYADRPGRPPAALRVRRGLDGLRRAA